MRPQSNNNYRGRETKPHILQLIKGEWKMELEPPPTLFPAAHNKYFPPNFFINEKVYKFP